MSYYEFDTHKAGNTFEWLEICDIASVLFRIVNGFYPTAWVVSGLGVCIGTEIIETVK